MDHRRPSGQGTDYAIGIIMGNESEHETEIQ